jgi:hypothetical protein
MDIVPTALTGLVTVTSSSIAVVGVGTLFTLEVVAGQLVKLDAHGEDSWTRVLSVTDDTNLVLAQDYRGVTGSGATSVGDWTLSFFSKISGAETAHTFSLNQPLEIHPVKVFSLDEIPFISPTLEPRNIGGGGSGGGGGGTGAGVDSIHVGVLLLPADTVKETEWAPGNLTVVKVQAFADTPPVTAGFYRLYVTGAGNNLLSAAFFDMESLVAGTITDIALTGTIANLDLLTDDEVEIRLESDNADLTGTGIWVKLVYELDTGPAFDNTEDVTTVFVPYAVVATDEVVVGDTGGGAFAITLPLTTDLSGRRIRLKRVGANDLTITPAGGDTIDGGGSQVLSTDGGSITLISDSANTRWVVV